MKNEAKLRLQPQHVQYTCAPPPVIAYSFSPPTYKPTSTSVFTKHNILLYLLSHYITLLCNNLNLCEQSVCYIQSALQKETKQMPFHPHAAFFKKKISQFSQRAVWFAKQQHPPMVSRAHTWNMIFIVQTNYILPQYPSPCFNNKT